MVHCSVQDQPARSHPAWFPAPRVGFLSLQIWWCWLQLFSLALRVGLVDLEAAPWIQDKGWHLALVVGCPLLQSVLRLESQAGSVLPLVSISSWVISLNPAVQFFSKVWIVEHHFVHMHYVWLCLGMALYLIRH